MKSLWLRISSTTWLRKSFRVVERLLAAVGLVSIIYHVGFSLSVMVSPSMAPTLQGTSFESGDWVLTERVSGWFRKPKRWEIVTFHDAEGIQIMKRVVGLPGESIAIKKFQVSINDQELAHPASLDFLKYYSYGNVSNGKSVACHDGYFVLGDDSKDSQDSRYEGPVPPHRIEGRALCIVWPLSRIRFINP